MRDERYSKYLDEIFIKFYSSLAESSQTFLSVGCKLKILEVIEMFYKLRD